MAKWRHALFCGTAMLGLAPAYGAAAQEAVQEVVVTAQRRTEVLENVPMAVTVVTPQRLAYANVVSSEELGRVTAGLQFNFAGGFIQPAIRGITTLTNGNNVETNVAIYVDGFYQASTVTINADLANLDSIEVLKGPQGALYGRNATGGAILINTLGPTKTFRAHVEAGYGNYNTKTWTGFVSGPINDRFRYSLATHFRETPGYLQLISPTTIGASLGRTGKELQYSIHAKLEADITPDLTAQLGYAYAWTQDNRIAYYSVYGHVNPAVEPPPPLRPTQFGDVATNYGAKNYAFRHVGTLKLSYNTPIGMLNSYTGFSGGVDVNQFDFDGSYKDITYNNIKFHQETFQQSVDYHINAIKNLDLVVGGFYLHNFLKPSQGHATYTFAANGALASATYANQTTDAWALYFDGTYHLTDRLSISVGGRYSHETKAIYLVSTNAAGKIIGGPIDTDVTWSKFTPRASIRYELAARTNIYATFSQGFRSGNYNASPPAAGVPYFPTAPESVNAYEIGFKTARSRVRFNTSAFYYDYKDINVSVLVPNPSCPPGQTCGFVTLFGNAPGATIYGIDGEVTISPIDQLNIHIGAQWLHARYKTFTNATGVGVDPTNSVNIPNQIQDWTGQRLARAPDWSGNIGVDYTHDISYGSLVFAGNLNFTSSFAMYNPALYGPVAPVELRDKERFVQNSYALLSAQITWYAPSKRYYVEVYSNNLTNQLYFLSYNGSTFGDTHLMADPRTFGFKVGANF
jgi:iron complex outermembrane receptor protein